jgi:hypothetical protein
MCAESIDVYHKNAFEEYASRFIEEYDWIFYVSPAGVEIENNNVRATDPNYRNHIDGMIKYLFSTKINHITNFGIISGTTEDRLKQIKFYLNI